jgi:hypothetical protein
MAKRQTDRQRLARRIESLDEAQVGEVLDFISILESARRTATSRHVREDELIAVLADAHENRRARQAFEWESVRRRAERRVATISSRT